ncbi:MAG TPA: GNAT family N-acetyltransferase [bacterium]|nr:GNAT family N-acetyltransferase [bacterium]
MPRADRHPDHDRLVSEVPSWYTVSAPRAGHPAERRRYGFYGRAGGAGVNRVTVAGLAAAEAGVFVRDLREYFGGAPVRIVVDDLGVDREIGAALLDAGCTANHSLVYLAHVGAVPAPPAVPDLRVEPVTEETLREFVTVRIKGFADSEREPPALQIEEETARRRTALAADSHLFIARIRGEAAGVVGWRAGRDRFIFQLATRVPFRGRRIATAVLCRILTDADAQGCASVVINTDPDGLAIHLYRRLGFVDEVCRQQRYTFNG